MAKARVSDVSTLWRHASLSTLYTHTTAADTGCQGNRKDKQPDNLAPIRKSVKIAPIRVLKDRQETGVGAVVLPALVRRPP
eukprot:2173483-Pyramimonas_sp.AAC.1